MSVVMFVVVDCGDPGTPRYGARSTLSHTTYSATVTYSCKTGYLLSGDLERICLDNGEWSGTLPTCRRKPRPSPPICISSMYVCQSLNASFT